MAGKIRDRQGTCAGQDAAVAWPRIWTPSIKSNEKYGRARVRNWRIEGSEALELDRGSREDYRPPRVRML